MPQRARHSSLIALGLTLSACTAAGPATGGGGSNGRGDSGALPDTGDSVPGDGALSVAPVGASFPLSLRVAPAEPGALSFAVTATGGGITRGPFVWSGEGEPEVVVWGFPAGTSLTLEASLTTADATLASASATAAVPLPDAEFPVVRGEVSNGGSSFRGYAVYPVLSPPGGLSTPTGAVVLVDERGALVWGATTANEMPTRARFRRDGRGVLVIGSRVESIGFDGSRQEWDIPAHHDVIETPEGILATLSQEPVLDSAGNVIDVTDAITEILPDGRRREVYALSQHLDALGLIPGEPRREGFDLTHANTIAYDEPSGTYVVGLASLPAVIAVNRFDGTLRGMVDARRRTGSPLQFDEQLTLTHEISLVDGGFTWFFNDTEAVDCAGILRVDWDFAGGPASARVQLRPRSCEHTFMLGGGMAVGDGLLATWSTSGKSVFYEADESATWAAVAPFGNGLGYADWAPSLPVSP
jgi:hypothetical protein